jgi:hypothetical protein
MCVCPWNTSSIGWDVGLSLIVLNILFVFTVSSVPTIWGHKNWYNDKDISRDVSSSLLFLQYEQYEDIKTDTMIKIYHVMFLRLYYFFTTTIWGHTNWYNDKDISRDVSTSLLFLHYQQYEDIQTDTTIKIYHVMFLRLYCFFTTNNMRT